jgi:glycosyltransferase involved in cell wall biosynthesis
LDGKKTVSVGVCAFNEEKNIRSAIESTLSQPLIGASLAEVIVVSSASTDRTDAIVREMAKKDSRIRLVSQKERKGKTSAVNLFMSQAKGDLLVLVNADNRLGEGALQKLLEPFQDGTVGAVGGHPVPTNSRDTTIGFAVYLLWAMHHQLSMVHPKLGELIAFRNVGIQIPGRQSTDEDYIRMEMERKGYRTVYAPDAIVLNRGPENLEDFWKQRVRVNIGEKYMKARFEYKVPTWDMRFLFPSMVSLIKENRRVLGKIAVSMALELAIRIYASVYVALDKGDQSVWAVAETTKKLD